MTDHIRKKLSDSKVARWTALALVSFAMMCSYFVYDVVAPLEDTLMRTLEWSSMDYSFFTSSYSFFNVFLLMLILGGLFLDKIGIRVTGTVCCVLMSTGVFIKAYALSDWFPLEAELFGHNSRMIVASLGFAVFGMGAETSYVAMNKVVAKWFAGKELALAMGLQVSLARIGTAIALSSSIPLYSYFQSISAPVWIGLVLVLAGTLSFFVYCVMDRREDRSAEALSSKGSEDEFKFSDIKLVLANKGFWLIAVLCILFYSAVFPFLKYATKLMIYKYEVPEDWAGSIPAILPFGTILLTPFFGRIYDSIGKGATLMLVGSFMLTLVHVMFALPLLNEWWFAIFIMIVLGIAFSLVPSAMWPSVVKIIPARQLGTAYSLIFYLQNCGLMTVPLLIGWTIENYAKQPAGDGSTYDYTVPMCVFTLLGLLSMLFAFWLKKVDKKEGYGLEQPTNRKEKP